MEKILVIEDNDLLRENISEILSLEGYELFVAENGKIGVDMAREFLPDLIISDVNMPIMDGFEVLEQIRSDELVRTTPFIFLTVKNTMKELRVGMNLGADDYLTKPFDMNQLLSAVDTRLNKKNEIFAIGEQKYDRLKNSIGLPIAAVIDDPLRNIERLAELVTGQLTNLSGEDIGEITQLIAEDASKLRKDINKVLYFYRIEVLKNNPESVAELSQMITSQAKGTISAITRNALKQSGRENDLTLHIEDVDIKLPEEFVQYILEELLNNACRFSAKGSSIVVSGVKVTEGYQLTIRDNGIGFKGEKDMNEIAPYIRLSQQQHKSDGLGLGLYIVKTLVELFDGQMELNSEPGHGTSISMTFDLAS